MRKCQGSDEEVLRKSRRSDKDLPRKCQGRVSKLWRKKLDSVKDMSKVEKKY